MFKLKYIDKETEIIIETKEVNNFDNVRYILSNSPLLFDDLRLNTRKVSIEYNSIELYSYDEEELIYSLEFETLINKIDFSLLSFSNIAILLQQYILYNPAFKNLLLDFEGVRFENLGAITFTDGKTYSVEDISIDGFSNVEVVLRVLNGKLRLNLVKESGEIVYTKEYEFDEIDFVTWLETKDNSQLFELAYYKRLNEN